MWYVLQCREGREDAMIRACRRHLSAEALNDAFSFRCERLWRRDGEWKRMEKELFPGYVFLESSRPDLLAEELRQFAPVFRVLGGPDLPISVCAGEEESLRRLCGRAHYLALSYGYRENGTDYITSGPLALAKQRIRRIDWHRRFAQVEVSIGRRRMTAWAGIGLDERITGRAAKEPPRLQEAGARESSGGFKKRKR